MERISRFRAILLLILFITILALFALKLFDLQIIKTIVNTDTTPLKKQYEEMHKIGVNINQIAKKVNTTGDLYPEEMQELKEMVKELWRILRSSPLK